MAIAPHRCLGPGPRHLFVAATLLVVGCLRPAVQAVPDAVRQLEGRRTEVLLTSGGWVRFDSLRLAGDSVVGWRAAGADAQRTALPVAAVRWVRPAPAREQVVREQAAGLLAILLGAAALAWLGLTWLISATEHT